MPARSLGRWEVLARLASGGSGHVFLARRPRLDGYAVACLKVLPRGATAEQREGLRVEARLLGQLDHPAIVEVLELVAEPEPFLVMELLVGERLDGVMQQAREAGRALPPALSATIAQALLDGLHHAHQRVGDDGAAHRDVSPPNVILTYDGQSKLLDFGIAQHAREHATLTGLIRGRPGYMSPEQLTGGRVDHRTDVYAVGVLLWELLTNDRLHGGVEPGQVAWAHQRPAPPARERNPAVPPELEAIAARALEREPDARFASAARMSRALGAYLEDSTTPWGNTALARLLQDRFPQRRAARQSVLTLLEAGPDYDEAALLAAFSARAPMALDLPAESGSDEATPAVPVGGPDTLQSDPGDTETERGPAQPGLRYEDVTEANADEQTVLDPSAQALVFAPEPAATVTPSAPAPPAAPAASDVETDPDGDDDPAPGGADTAPTTLPGPAPIAPPSPSGIAATHVPEGRPAPPPLGDDPTAALGAAALRQLVEAQRGAAPTVPPTGPEVVEPRGPTAQLESPPPPGSSPLASWQFWLVLALGLLLGVAGGAAVTWSLIGG